MKWGYFVGGSPEKVRCGGGGREWMVGCGRFVRRMVSEFIGTNRN